MLFDCDDEDHLVDVHWQEEVDRICAEEDAWVSYMARVRKEADEILL